MQPEEIVKTTRRKVTLADQGPRLPIGGIDAANGELVKQLACRSWNLKREKLLGKLRDKHDAVTPAEFVPLMLSLMIEQFGPHTPSGELAKVQNDSFNITQSWQGDVMYAYFWLRREALGPLFDCPLVCPACRAKLPMQANLDTLEVETVDKLEDTFWSYNLKNPISVRKERVSTLHFGPVRWRAIVDVVANRRGISVDIAGKIAMIMSGLRGYDDKQNAGLSSDDLDELSKLDLEHLASLVEENACGPDLSVEAKCHRCKHEFRTALDWSYGPFFGVSGRSDR